MILISQMEKRFVLYSVRILHKITRTKSQTVDCLALCVTTRIYIPLIFGIFVLLSVYIIQGVNESNFVSQFFFYSKTNQMHNISLLFYLEQHSTCFGRSPPIISSLRLYIQHQVYVIQVLWLLAMTWYDIWYIC